MTRHPRLLGHALGALLLACVGIAVPAPAGATITRLCTGYTACANAGMSSSGYAQVSGTMFWRMYSGHNCTNYVAYRMVKAGMPNVRPWDGGGNATYWGTSNASITDNVPKVGAVAWWRAGVYPAGSAGHVAYVERVVSDTEIIVSQDFWGGDFSWARITKTSGWPSGFVHFKDATLENTERPVVSGQPKVGEDLTTTTGAWSQAGTDVAVEWRAGGEPIAGATGSSLRLTKALVGSRVRVKVTATKPGFPTATATSVRTAPVQAGEITNTELPVISGEPVVDSTLTASGGRWSPAAEARTYQWRADGTPLSGRTATTLPVTADLVGKAISVTVSASRAGYETVAATSPRTAPVTQASLHADPPEIAGSNRIGEALTLAPGSATPDAQRTVQWLRDGDVVAGAGGLRYNLTAEDLGRRISAKVSWTRNGYRSLALETPATGLVKTEPSMRTTLEKEPGKFVATATVTAPGLDVVPSTVTVVRRGAVLAEGRVRADGTARLVVADQAAGTRNYRFVLARTDATTRVLVVRQITVR